VLPCAPVYDVKGALANRFAGEREIVQSVPHPKRGEMRIVRQPIKVNGAIMPRKAAPALGADTDDVLHELGLNNSEIDALEASGVILRAR